FSDEQLKALIQRDAVIGAAFDAWMMAPNWERQLTQPYEAGVNIERIIEHIDHICQLAGNARHCGIGSDLDGGFGREQCPYDMESIADLQKLTTLLANRGYSQEDIAAIMHGNWIRRLNEKLP
ncbi:MAG: membrane dipeptidase, partial [Planctomycetales bacterium]|nr:membrane dipeptidase [Planctomycetales bacterium]